MAWVHFVLMSLHFNITSGAMNYAYRAPLNHARVTFQIMFIHFTKSIFIIIEELMTALIAYDTIVALVFKRGYPLLDS